MTSRERVQSILTRLGRARVYLLLILVFALMALVAPRFLTVDNQIALLKKASIHMIPAIGFTPALAIGRSPRRFTIRGSLARCVPGDRARASGTRP